MSADKRLDAAFAHAPVLPLTPSSRYVLFSDCHRGCGTNNDNFLKNQNLYFAALEHYYNDFPQFWGKYGLKDAYNLESDKPWYAKEYIGIDKGISMIMIENYLTGLIWEYFMKNKYVLQGLKELNIKKRQEIYS